MGLSGCHKRFFFLYLIAGVFAGSIQAQVGIADSAQVRKEKSMFSVGLGAQHGFIFAHSEAVENTKGSRPTGVEAILAWQRNDAAVWDLCRCYPRKGLLLSYYDYDNAVLGKSVTAAYFLEPVYKITGRSYFSFKGSAGFSYLTNPYDSVKNPSNQSYSSHLSGYLLVGAGVWLRLGERWWLNASANYQHISNGGLREPNKGINWPTAGLALSYAPAYRPYYSGARPTQKAWRHAPVRWDIGLFGIARRSLNENGQSRRLPLIGLALQGSKQVGRISALTLGAEGYRDEELRVQLKRDSIQASPVKAGIMAGHEFLLGRFLFTQQLGVYVFDQTPYYDLLFHRWGLHYRINQQVGIGFNLKAHRHIADFVDLRVTYSLPQKEGK